MGSVHAKSLPAEKPEQHRSSSLMSQLQHVKARVDRVHVHGLGRTRDDMVRGRLTELWSAASMSDVLQLAQQCRHQLLATGCFRRVGVLVDTSQTAADGLQVTFDVEEVRRVTAGVQTQVGQNEGCVQVSARLPNTLGRGENCQLAYAYGLKNSSAAFDATFVKPYFNAAQSSLSASLYQTDNLLPTSSYQQLNRGALLKLSSNIFTNLSGLLEYEAQWRHLTAAGGATPLSVRRHCGHWLASAVRWSCTYDSRDSSIVPDSGTLFKLQQEFAGLGGNIQYLKHQAELQLNYSLRHHVTVQAGLRLGHLMPATGADSALLMTSSTAAASSPVTSLLHPSAAAPPYGSHISDRFFLGGALDLRGFEQRCAGGRRDGGSFLGGDSYWAAALHVYAPLPFRPGRGGLGELFRTHLFVNTGNLHNMTWSGDETVMDAVRRSWRTARLVYGLGLCIQLANTARVELNYCVPVWSQADDRTVRGLQLGIGVAFL